jgi:hypothetical protein
MKFYNFIIDNIYLKLFRVTNILSPFQKNSISRVILSQTILSLTKFIEKTINIYDTK